MTDPHRPNLPDRDPALDAAWKAHSTEFPPPRVDAAILAAAHREARTRPRAVGDDDGVAHARGPSRTWWGLAAAATIGAIAFGVLQLAPPTQMDESTTVATDVPRTAPEPAPPVTAPRDTPSQLAETQRLSSGDPRAPTAAPTAPQERDRGAALTRAPEPMPSAAPPASAQKPMEEKRRRADAPARQRESAVESPAPTARALAEAPIAAAPPPAPPEAAATAPKPFPGGAPAPSIAAAPPSPPAPASTPPADIAKTEAASNAVDARRRESGERMAAAVAPSPATQPARRAQADGAAQGAATAPVAKLQVRTPAAWIETIRALHAQQRFEEAARELNAFRDAYSDADTQLPVALQAWAESVKRN